jgi:HAD superfamily hydrolase (TIGR01509 family)
MIIWDIDGVLIWYHPANPALDWRAKITDRLMLDLWEDFQKTVLWQSCLTDTSQDVYAAWGQYLDQENQNTKEAAEIVNIWMAYNTEFNQPALDCLKKFHAIGIPCAIASNQDAKRAALVVDLLRNEGLGDLPVFISSQMGVAKPDPVFFGRIEQELQQSGENIIFLEDNAENIVAARERGWQTFQVDFDFDWLEFGKTIIKRNKRHE